MLTSEQIAAAKQAHKSKLEKPLHEHDDCIRIAYQWLDAQPKTQKPIRSARALKHIIEKWGGRYVSQSDVEVAAAMHPDVIGEYPNYNIGKRLTLPSPQRLEGIGEANTQDYKMSDRHIKETYAQQE